MTRRLLRPGEEYHSPPGQELLGVITPMGRPENPTRHSENREADRRKRLARRPRTRRCLLKGVRAAFHLRQARQRYCSERCREAARRWSRGKAQQRYRETAAGQQKRNWRTRSAFLPKPGAWLRKSPHRSREWRSRRSDPHGSGRCLHEGHACTDPMAGTKLAVPLAQLTAVAPDEAIGDWHYWVDYGYQL